MVAATDSTELPDITLGEDVTGGRDKTTILADTGQRDALIAFVDEALGPPELHREGQRQFLRNASAGLVDDVDARVLHDTQSSPRRAARRGRALPTTATHR